MTAITEMSPARGRTGFVRAPPHFVPRGRNHHRRHRVADDALEAYGQRSVVRVGGSRRPRAGAERASVSHGPSSRRFQPPPRRTERADFQHSALLPASRQGVCDIASFNDFYFPYVVVDQTLPTSADNQIARSYERRIVCAFRAEKANIVHYATWRKPGFPELTEHDPVADVPPLSICKAGFAGLTYELRCRTYESFGEDAFEVWFRRI
jgi:hypothetical protein